MSKVPILDLDALMGKELNDVVCAAYKMGCDQTREIYQKRIEKLEAALEALSHIHDGNPSDAYAGVPELDYARHMLWEARQIARKALEEKDD